MPHRVVITGIGTVNPLALDTADTWAAMLAGKSGIAPITAFDTTGFDTTIAGEVKGFDPTNYMDRKEARRTDRFSHFAIAAAREALAQAHFTIDASNAADVGVMIGSGIGGILTLEEQIHVLRDKGPGRVSPFIVPAMIVNAAGGIVSILTGAQGPMFAIVSACSSGADALGEAFEIIRRGDATAMLAGGTEAAVSPISIAGFNAARALSTRNDDPQGASRPFDSERNGFVMSEGAAILFLEELEAAKARGATIIAEMVGYGATADAHHMTAPLEDGSGGARAMRRAMEKGGIAPADVSYINAHGTSTRLNDKTETLVIKTVLGQHAATTPISSTKSMVGHMIAGAGAIEAAVCALAIRDGMVPPTINYSTPDPECDLDYVPNQSRKVTVDVALSNSLGFGGHNSCLAFRKYRE
ncbi:MAG: beta-ketoacyl-[acyl-carrier-protein] synthase II [Dehalococcoidia bacterium]|nr:beta-ketoacyl-[acyl-carrier-protein] synthase II [Dehalococcoidia bacterium]